jgi:hypothetical protein
MGDLREIMIQHTCNLYYMADELRDNQKHKGGGQWMIWSLPMSMSVCARKSGQQHGIARKKIPEEIVGMGFWIYKPMPKSS